MTQATSPTLPHPGPPLTGTCRVCAASGLIAFPEFPALARVTSDCRPWPPGGRLFGCPVCGGVQKSVDAAALAECAAIYQSYALYHQGSGGEQRIFDQKNGTSRPRSELFVEHLARSLDLPSKGKLLDFGCGRGDFLRSFRAVFPDWSLSGFEPGQGYATDVAAVPATYLHGDAHALPRDFDLVCSAHTLEHVPDPAASLRVLHERLAPHGILALDVPDWRRNPFDLVIADHLGHFSNQDLARLLTRTGFSGISLSGEVLPKEWTALACKAAAPLPAPAPLPAGAAESLESVRASLAWLSDFVAQARAAAGEAKSFGVFGTAIGAAWLYGALDCKVDFFVDEDSGRARGEFCGRPVVRPEEAPAGATLHLALPPAIAAKAAARLAALPLRLTLPCL